MSFYDRLFAVHAARSSERTAWHLAASAERAFAREDDVLTGARREAFRDLHARWAAQADELAGLEDEVFAFPEDRLEHEAVDYH